MEEIGTPTKSLTVRVDVPQEVTLPVLIDDKGVAWPHDGLMFQKHIHHSQLHAIGVRVIWKRADGTIVPESQVKELLAERLADQKAGYVPTFSNVGG
jgi:hypothetical protein